jgi:hypothetical protein
LEQKPGAREEIVWPNGASFSLTNYVTLAESPSALLTWPELFGADGKEASGYEIDATLVRSETRNLTAHTCLFAQPRVRLRVRKRLEIGVFSY